MSGTEIRVGASWGRSPYAGDFPFRHELADPIVIDATKLSGRSHPMFLLRLRSFVDWHRASGRVVNVLRPVDEQAARQVGAAMETSISPATNRSMGSDADHEAMLSVRTLAAPQAVEDTALEAVDALHRQAPTLAAWGDPAYMVVSELCGNAIQHGRNDVLPAYVAADRIEGDHRLFRLAVADIGIGIPEHIRGRHPEWHDDTGAITKALERGITGTKDPHRGNGFAEVFDETLDRQLVASRSAVTLEIRSGKGAVSIELVDGRRDIQPIDAGVGRRGTWITYTVTTI